MQPSRVHAHTLHLPCQLAVVDSMSFTIATLAHLVAYKRVAGRILDVAQSGRLPSYQGEVHRRKRELHYPFILGNVRIVRLSC